MKFNWGHGIAIGIGAFMAFIIFMVVQTFRTNTDLTAEDYYSQELSFQKDIDARQNSESLEGSFTVRVKDGEVLISIPEELRQQNLGGSVHFYRAEKASLDRTFSLRAGSDPMRIPTSELAAGPYEVRILASLNGKDYSHKAPIHIPVSRP